MSNASLALLAERDLPELAAFLERSLREAGYGGARGHPRELMLERLRWRLLRNPARQDEVPFGDCVRDAAGEIVGSLVYTPIVYRLGDQRLLGVNSGYFFAASTAPGWGLVMLRRFTKFPGAPIRYSSSLNVASSGLWHRLGGTSLPGCEIELLLPVGWGAVLEELALRRGRAARLVPARLMGALLSPAWRRLALGARPLRLEPCRDWDELAALAELHRPRDRVVAERSVAYLRWRFEQCPGAERVDVLRFEDERGRRGWVALLASQRGQREQIRTRTVLTLVRPLEGFDALAFLRGLAECYAGRADLVALGTGTGWSGLAAPRVLTNRHAEPPFCMIGSDAAGRPYVERAALSLAEGDAVE